MSRESWAWDWGECPGMRIAMSSSAEVAASASSHRTAAKSCRPRSRSRTVRWSRLSPGRGDGTECWMAASRRRWPKRLGQHLGHQLRSALAVHLVARAVEDRPGATELGPLPGELERDIAILKRDEALAAP